MQLNLEWYEWLGVASALFSFMAAVSIPAIRRRLRLLDLGMHRIAPRDNVIKLRSAWDEALPGLNRSLYGLAALYSISFRGPPDLSRQTSTDCPVLAAHQTPELHARAAAIRADPKLNNKPHGFADSRDVCGGTSVIRYIPGDYAVVKAARNAGLRPPALSGNAIVFCQATGQVLLQVRNSTATYPKCLHIFGGNYEPSVDVAENDDAPPGPSLKTTTMREVEEECGLWIEPGSDCIVFTGAELTTGFVRATYAGLSIPSADRSKVRAPAEGRVEWISFKELEKYAATGVCFGEERDIVPSGALDLMMWLRLGAPDQYRETPNREAALRAFRALLANAPSRIAQSPYPEVTKKAI